MNERAANQSNRGGKRAAVGWLLLWVAGVGLTGCVTNTVSKAKLATITFGTELQGLESRLGAKPISQFQVATTNGILEMRSVYCENYDQPWYLLFANGKFISARPRGGFRPWGMWPGFSDESQPDFNEISWFWRDFFPPEEPRQRLAPQPNDGPKANWAERHQDVGMMIGMAPFLPFAVVAAPVHYLAVRPERKRMMAMGNLQPGMEAKNLTELFGPPVKQTGNARRAVLSFRHPAYVSIGIEDERVAFIFSGFDINR